MASGEAKVCQWTTQAGAISAFAKFEGKTQSANHITPLHWHIACRLVIEGGFDPDDIVPRPPFRIERRPKGAPVLHFEPSAAGGGERTVLGGLKTKQVDVVVTREGIGPVLAVSCKGVTGAFRNLTNRMEETIGECTNLHITYPALVLGYFVLLRGNKGVEQALDDAADVAGEADDAVDAGKILTRNDIAISEGGEPVASIIRFHNALRELVGRKGIRNDLSRYEAIGFGLADMTSPIAGQLVESFPNSESPLHCSRFFDALYLRYDERFVIGAPDLENKTRRLEWDATSPALTLGGRDFPARLAD